MLHMLQPRSAKSGFLVFVQKSRLSANDPIADVREVRQTLDMVQKRRSFFVHATDWFGDHSAVIGILAIVFAVFVSVFGLQVNSALMIIGFIIFLIAILLHARAQFGKEMKPIEELGFKRNRDAIVYIGLGGGMDWRFVSLSFVALAVSFIVGFGIIGERSGGAGLLAFSAFALLGAAARLKQRWPSDTDAEKVR